MKHILITGLLTLISLAAFSQNELEKAMNGPAAQRIRSMRVAFITDKLKLTPEQSQQFWPLYNAFEAEQKEIRKSKRAGKNMRAMTDKEVEQLINRQLEGEQQLLDAKKAYFNKLKSVISVRQIAVLGKAEREFKAYLLKEIQKRRKG